MFDKVIRKYLSVAAPQYPHLRGQKKPHPRLNQNNPNPLHYMYIGMHVFYSTNLISTCLVFARAQNPTLTRIKKSEPVILCLRMYARDHFKNSGSILGLGLKCKKLFSHDALKLRGIPSVEPQ